jgi:hypothetical protein
MKCHRDWHRDVDAYHADLNLMCEFPGRIAVSCEYRSTIADDMLLALNHGAGPTARLRGRRAKLCRVVHDPG